MLLARCETNFMYMSDSLSTGSLDQINKKLENQRRVINGGGQASLET